MSKVNKDIRKIRKSIKARKRMRYFHTKEREQLPLYTLTDEEKYNTYPDMLYVDESPKSKKSSHIFQTSFFYKSLLSFGLFLMSFLLIKTEILPLEKPKQLLIHSLQKDFPFATVHEWYVNYLGIPLSLVPKDHTAYSLTNDVYDSPVTGEVVESFSANGEGIMISPENKSFIHAVNRGIVIFAGQKNETDRTIVIQHPDRSQTTYGMLSTIDVHLYQTIEANAVIGTKTPTNESETVFFSIEKENSYIDPAKVIRVDGIP